MKRLKSLLHDKKVLAVDHSNTAFEVADYMTEKKIGAVPVLQDGNLVGIFTERDLMTRVVVPGLDARKLSVADVMTREVVVAHPEDRLDECESRMQRRHCRHLPVVKDGNLLGTISLRDLLVEDIRERNHEIEHLTNYIHDPGMGMA